MPACASPGEPTPGTRDDPPRDLVTRALPDGRLVSTMTTPMPNTPEGGRYPPERAAYSERTTERVSYPQGQRPSPGQGQYPPGQYPPQRPPRSRVDARAL